MSSRSSSRTLVVPLAAWCALLWAATGSLAQAPPGPRDNNPIERHLFPPDLVMAHQQEIGLTPEQRQSLVAAVQQMESDLVPLRFEMSELTQKMTRVLSSPKVDLDTALALADRITALEGEIKKRHLTLVIHTKNLLTAEQQRRLQELRSAPGGR